MPAAPHARVTGVGVAGLLLPGLEQFAVGGRVSRQRGAIELGTFQEPTQAMLSRDGGAADP